MAQVSIVTAARREAVAEQAGAAAVAVLNPGAREFLPWWRQGSAAVIVKKALSVDAPEFVTPANKGPAAADAGGNDATPPGNVRTGRVSTRPQMTNKCTQLTRVCLHSFLPRSRITARACRHFFSFLCFASGFPLGKDLAVFGWCFTRFPFFFWLNRSSDRSFRGCIRSIRGFPVLGVDTQRNKGGMLLSSVLILALRFLISIEEN